VGNALTWLCGMSETNSRKDYDHRGEIVYGSRNPGKAWREIAMTLSACLRPVCEDSFYHQLERELSPSAGGPPG